MATQATLKQTLKGYTPKAILDKIVVKPFDPDEKTEGGIVLPDQAQEKPRCGQVVHLGPGKPDEPMPAELKIDTVVVFSQYAGVEVLASGVSYIVMRADEVSCILEPPGA